MQRIPVIRALRGAPFVRRRADRRAQGFTLVEVMFALAILGMGLLAMLAMQIHALRGSRQGRHTSQAGQIARDWMETLHRVDWTDPQVQPQAWTVPQVLASTVQAPVPGGQIVEQNFNRQWRVTAVAGDPNLRQIDVRVTWNEPTDPAGMPPRRYAVTSFRHNDP